MILVFAATAAGRHPLASYLFSLGALALAILPFASASTSLQKIELRALLRGLKAGLVLTAFAVLISIFVQVLGMTLVMGPLKDWLVGPEATGTFLGYIRPMAGFSEPSHLAIYLITMYVFFDLVATPGRTTVFWRLLLVVTVLLVGSVSGLVLFGLYLFAKAAKEVLRFAAGKLANSSSSTVIRLIGLVSVVFIGFVLLGPNAQGLTEEYWTRVLQTVEAVQSGNLVGSEGSRVNAFLALPDFWAETGWIGVATGIGYANYQTWLTETYGYLGESATFARGGIDNLLVAILLSTGIVGLLFYIIFLYRGLGGRQSLSHLPVIVFILGVHFSYGYLISGLYWNLLLILAAGIRYSVMAAPVPKVTVRRARVVRRPIGPESSEAGA